MQWIEPINVPEVIKILVTASFAIFLYVKRHGLKEWIRGLMPDGGTLKAAGVELTVNAGVQTIPANSSQLSDYILAGDELRSSDYSHADDVDDDILTRIMEILTPEQKALAIEPVTRHIVDTLVYTANLDSGSLRTNVALSAPFLEKVIDPPQIPFTGMVQLPSRKVFLSPVFVPDDTTLSKAAISFCASQVAALQLLGPDRDWQLVVGLVAATDNLEAFNEVHQMFRYALHPALEEGTMQLVIVPFDKGLMKKVMIEEIKKMMPSQE